MKAKARTIAKKPKVPKAHKFSKEYKWDADNTVCILLDDPLSDKYMRVDPDDKGQMDANGTEGHELSQWNVQLTDDGNCRLQSASTQKYLQMMLDCSIDVRGFKDNPLTLFKPHVDPHWGQVMLESYKIKGKFINIKRNEDDHWTVEAGEDEEDDDNLKSPAMYFGQRPKKK